MASVRHIPQPELGFASPTVAVEEVPRCGANDEVLRVHLLDAGSVAKAVAGVVRQPA